MAKVKSNHDSTAVFISCVFVFSIMRNYGMYVSFLTFVLGYGQLLALNESLTVLLAVS